MNGIIGIVVGGVLVVALGMFMMKGEKKTEVFGPGVNNLESHFKAFGGTRRRKKRKGTKKK